jgi:glycosyltransferase involved in cell wall biosynthesis
MPIQEKISLLLPTRCRPHLIQRLFHSISEKTFNPENIEIILCLDDDDPSRDQIPEGGLNVVKIVGPRATMGTYNSIALSHASGDIIMLMNDDLTIETPQWDMKVIEFCRSITDGIFMAYPHDTDNGGKISSFPILSRKTCQILVDPFPRWYESLYIDHHLHDIFIRLTQLGPERMFYLKDIVFDHHHFSNGKVRQDASYGHKNRFRDSTAFINLRIKRQASAKRLFAAIEKKPLPSLPATVTWEIPPTNLGSAVGTYFRVFFRDYGLPFHRRFLLFASFMKYFAAMKSGIGFFKRKSYTLYGSG